MNLLHWWVYTFYGLLSGVIVLVIFLAAGQGAKTRNPSRFQSLMEWMLDGMRSLFSGAIGEGGQQYLPVILTLFFYVLVSNLLGLIPLFRSPTASTSTTIALGLFVFVFVQYVGIKHNGLGGYLRHFLGPVLALAPLLLIIELVGEIAKPFSLGMRLFGNVYGEDIINDLLTKAGSHAFFIPFQIPVYALQIFTDLIQAYIFAVLAASYIATFTSGHHQDEIDIPHEHENGGELKGVIPAADYHKTAKA